MRRMSFLCTGVMMALTIDSAVAQRYDETVYIFEEPPVEEVETVPAPVTTPSPVAAPPPLPVVAPVPPRKKKLPSFAFEDRALDAVTSPGLETFSSQREFSRYLERLGDIKGSSEADWAANQRPILIAAAMQDMATETPPDEICTDPESCPNMDESSVMVTGTRAAAPVSITNVQSAGVDEGDIVKQIGDYLLVLQDGRIFAVNIKTMQLTDRRNVYRPKQSGTAKRYYWDDDFDGADWYDEMLVQGDHVLITAYSYSDDASELSIFKLDQATGKVSPQGVFLITSDDYYDVDNYATRIVGDRLVVYTPYDIEQFEEADALPVLRRWLPESERKAKQDRGKPLFDARSIHKPVLRTAEPTIHSISVCLLGDFAQTRDLECRTTAFAGPADAEMFVSPDNVYLWNSVEADSWRLESCVPDRDWDKPYPALPRARRKDVRPGAVYRVPIRTGEPGVIGVSGRPYDQFSMDERDGQFRALADWRTVRCEDAYEAPAEVAYLAVPESEFGAVMEPVADRHFTAVPSPGKRIVENRFADDWLVYGGRDSWGSYPPDEEEEAQGAKAIAVPVKKPKQAVVIDLPHNIVRTERVGNDMMLNGYRDGKGLHMTLVGLGKDAKVASTLFLDRRFESEGRSHAFNSMVNADGTGVIGVPTVRNDDESGRWWWRSESSDLSFVGKAADGKLTDAGSLVAQKKDDVATHPDYVCEISCIDWYGNSRPIFTDGRIFGLMGTALVEAKMSDGKIGEVARIDLTAPLKP